MTTHDEEQIHDAVRRADAGRLSALLDVRDCSPAPLGRLIRHEDPALRHTGLALLAERLADTGPYDDAERAELAGLLPEALTGPPEADLLLARLHERLGPHLRGRPRPAWRTAGLPARVRTAWLRAELLDEPAVIRTEAPGELLYQAVRETRITGTHRPACLVDELAGSGDPVLRAEALRLARQGLHAGLLAPALVRDDLIGLLGADDDPVVAGALAELALPWAAMEPLPPGRLAPFLAASSVRSRPVVADAALETAARHGHGDQLRRIIDDTDLPPGLRRRAMQLLGALAGRDDIGGLTAVAARDPLLLAGPAVACLRGLHRRGHFVGAPDVAAVVALALADHSIPAREVATILFTCRNEMLRILTDVTADDPHWPRRLALLVALAGQGAAELPIGDAITRVLPSAPAPGPFLEAIRELRHADAEDAVIALLPMVPASALRALEAIGGQRTVRALREGLGLTAKTPAPWPYAVRNQALELLWLLNRDPEHRRTLLERLDPIDLPTRIAADLGGPDERELALLSSHLDPDEPVAALCRLAAHGAAGSLPAIADLLLRVVADQSASYERPGMRERPGTRERSGTRERPASYERHPGQPSGEPVVPQEVLDAVDALGRRLYERGAIRPVCLLDAADAREAGHALLATTALDLLDRPGLSGPEQAMLLELLLRAPWKGTRARVHRLLRHRDRQVRKQVIALLARDATGEDAQALSATLIALTAAQDIQTVRQALLALGHARAHWASAAIAACLDRPNMNIKKTAAEALVRAGTPAAVPKLLFWLGHHDNPGLRRTLLAALRAVLGDACAATLLAAAEHSRDARTRRLLLEGLDGALAAPSLLALDDQASPVAVPLLSLVAEGRISLASGDVGDLVVPLARHGTGPSAAVPRSSAHGAADRDVTALLIAGWNPSVALRVAERDEPLHPDGAAGLRPMLADWLRLADARPAHRDTVVRFALRVCPAPRSAAELTTFARSTGVLLAALADARDETRHDLIAVLEEVAPMLSAAARPAVAAAVRALRPASAAPNRSTLTLLRRLGAVLVRADLDQALASARLGADPWRAGSAVLREAFAVPEPAAAPDSAEARAWRAALGGAARAPGPLAEFRRQDDGTVGSRDRLNALIEVHPGANAELRAALLDWMTLLQPLDAPPWTLTETAHAPARPPRHVRLDDLDQPRSAAQRERLLSMLESPVPERRRTAAAALVRWPEPGARLPVLRAYLRGHIDLPAGRDLADVLGALDATELRGGDILHDRVALLASKLTPSALEPLVPLLLEWWEHAPPAVGPAVGAALRSHPADALARLLGDRLDAGQWGFLDLLLGRRLLRTPALTHTRRRLRAEGRDDLADRLLLVEGPLRGPEAAQQDAAALAALRDRAPAAPGTAAPRPSRRDLLDRARTGTTEQTLRALTELAGAHTGPDPVDDPAVRDLIGELLTDPRAEVRLRAHRTSRTVLDRRTYLGHTVLLLEDPRPDVLRTAIRTLGHAGWEPAIPALTDLLGHPRPVVRRAAAEGLVAMGAAAIPALRRSAAHARPDRRSRYTDVLDRIGDASPSGG
ncbi:MULTISPECIES: HEAT repeat domain-containing protein [unclassified Streptomyces]|uniref:HEAT repeat domain-containing protein n=1 Tax=unclassified Streptomyces TaxID=2593676 RepID=UPI0036E49BDC